MNVWHGGQKKVCFNCGDPDHFITNYRQAQKMREHTSGKHKSTGLGGRSTRRHSRSRVLQDSGSLRACFLAWPPSVTSRRTIHSDSSSSGNNESDHKTEDKVNGLSRMTHLRDGAWQRHGWALQLYGYNFWTHMNKTTTKESSLLHMPILARARQMQAWSYAGSLWIFG